MCGRSQGWVRKGVRDLELVEGMEENKMISSFCRGGFFLKRPATLLSNRRKSLKKKTHTHKSDDYAKRGWVVGEARYSKSGEKAY